MATSGCYRTGQRNRYILHTTPLLTDLPNKDSRNEIANDK
jgi:hypothetical protein